MTDGEMGKIVPRGTYSFFWTYAHVNWIINSKDFENIFGLAAGSQPHSFTENRGGEGGVPSFALSTAEKSQQKIPSILQPLLQ